MIQLGGELGIFDHRLDSSRFDQVNGLLSRFMGKFSDFLLVSRHFLPSPSVCPPHYSSFSPLSAKSWKLEVSSSNSQFYWFYK